MRHPALQFVKSAHDIGSAIAHRLKTAGERPVLLESATPGATRRLMCFAGAVVAGSAELEGLRAVRCGDAAQAAALADRPGVIPLLVTALDDPLPLPAEALIDARMRKRHEPPVQLDQAPLVIGIGPGFVAGRHVHLVIESNHGARLGRVIGEGAAEAYTGRHRLVEGYGAERYLYAPHAGTFHSGRALLEAVAPGETVGRVDDTPLPAAAEGILRGLAYDGLRVEAGAKLAEIDPTGKPDNCRGIHERPARIAAGVLEALARFRAGGPPP
jgi:xanthine dehydrogenase accessory factor